MKAEKLVFKNEKNEKVILFGIVNLQTEDYIVFETGSGRKYTVSKHRDFFLAPTNKEFTRC